MSDVRAIWIGTNASGRLEKLALDPADFRREACAEARQQVAASRGDTTQLDRALRRLQCEGGGPQACTARFGSAF
jgi:hypothetical protein